MTTRDDIARAIEPYLRIYVATLDNRYAGPHGPGPVGEDGPLVTWIEQSIERAREEGFNEGVKSAAATGKGEK